MRALIKGVFTTTNTTFADLEGLVQDALQDGAKSLFVLACDENGLDPVDVNPLLRSLSVPVFGGVFPTILHGRQHFEQGYIVVGLRQSLPVAVFEEVSQLNPYAPDQVSLPDALTGASSLLVLVDGLASTIDYLIGEIYNQIGPERPVLGGGAGSLSFERRPCLFSNRGMLSDALQVVGLPDPLQTSVRHGWEKLAGPFLVTESDANVIRSLNYRPAFDVYREVVEPYATARFEDTDFFEIAKTFPFGMEKLDEALLVRDPIIHDNGALVCVGNVPENTMVYVLRGKGASLTGAAGDAARGAGSDQPEGADVVVFDCISRKLFLEGEFAAEMEAICAPFSDGTHVVGALSLGEIANSAGGSIHFHNKTVVVGSYAVTHS